MEEVVCSWATTAYTWIEARLDWESLRDFGNSTFFTSIAGAFAGAWAGGRIAQILAMRSKEKEELAREIRNANAAATMASALCDDLAGSMRQYVRPLKQQYETDLATVTALLAAEAAPNGTASPLTVVANLQQLSGPALHTEPLQRLIFNDISNEKVLRLFVALSQSVSNVHSMIKTRNQLVEEFRATQNPAAVLRYGYFGFRHPMGHIDDRYKSALAGLYTSTQDGIYFSMHLSLMLAAHAGELARRCKKEFRGPVPKAIKLDFTRLKERGLLPDSKDYPDWDVLLAPPLPKDSLFRHLVKRIRNAWGKRESQ